MVMAILPEGFLPQYRYAFNADFVYVREKIAIFVDGDFWHGKYFEEKKEKYTEHWRNHIQGNIDRDKRNRGCLREDGWAVLSFWEGDIYKDIGGVEKIILAKLSLRRKRKPTNYQSQIFL